MAYNHPIGSIYHLYTTYSPCLLGGYIIPTTLYRNLKNPLNFQDSGSRGICVWSWNSAPEVEDFDFFFLTKKRGRITCVWSKNWGGGEGGMG